MFTFSPQVIVRSPQEEVANTQKLLIKSQIESQQEEVDIRKSTLESKLDYNLSFLWLLLWDLYAGYALFVMNELPGY